MYALSLLIRPPAGDVHQFLFKRFMLWLAFFCRYGMFLLSTSMMFLLLFQPSIDGKTTREMLVDYYTTEIMSYTSLLNNITKTNNVVSGR